MKTIEYFFSTHSAYAYFGSATLRRLAAAHGRRILHRPFEFWPVIHAARGVREPLFSEAYHAYYFGLEIERWSAFRQAPIALPRPTHHDNPLALSSGMVIAADQNGQAVDDLAHAILEAHWRDDADIADPDRLAAIARAAGLEAEPLLAEAVRAETQAVFRANTEEAIGRAIFGSPTYFLDGEMFYGQDRLELMAYRLGAAEAAAGESQ